MQVPIHFEPRHYQAEAIRKLEEGTKRSVWCWARRAGKDLTAFSYGVKKMIEEPMNVALVFPTKEQGRKAFWENVENDGFRTIDHIPKELIARYDNTNMNITLKNGSTFSLLSAKDPDSLRGANAKLYILSEFVYMSQEVLDVISPILAVNNGQVIIQSTPKIDGISGGSFKLIYELAEESPKQHASLITAREYLDDETLEEIRQEAIAKYGNDFFFKQEFLCDWGQASSAAYYGHILQQMEQNGRIGDHPHNPKYPVYTAWDWGLSDSTAITFFQYYDKKLRIIDYYETNNAKISSIIQDIQSKPYNYGWHFFPHDTAVRESDLITRLEKVRDQGLPNSSLLIREPREDGLNRAISNIGAATLHKPTCSMLIRKLYLYQRKFNPNTGDYIGPEKNTSSHAADSIRYVFNAVEREFDPETCEMYFSGSNATESYESIDLATNLYSP